MHADIRANIISVISRSPPPSPLGEAGVRALRHFSPSTISPPFGPLAPAERNSSCIHLHQFFEPFHLPELSYAIPCATGHLRPSRRPFSRYACMHFMQVMHNQAPHFVPRPTRPRADRVRGIYINCTQQYCSDNHPTGWPRKGLLRQARPAGIEPPVGAGRHSDCSVVSGSLELAGSVVARKGF